MEGRFPRQLKTLNLPVFPKQKFGLLVTSVSIQNPKPWVSSAAVCFTPPRSPAPGPGGRKREVLVLLSCQ